MMNAAELELLGGLEDELETTPQFGYRSYPISESFAEAEWVQPLECPRAERMVVRGYPRYGRAAASLPAAEQAKLRQFARAVVESFREGCSPVRILFITGHADRDVQRGRDFENRVSRERALQIGRTLLAFMNNRVIASRIMWKYRGAGASQLAVPNPSTESDRRLNRRVEILPISCSSLVANRRFLVTAQEVYLEALWRITPYGENLSGFAGLGR
jgi:outer membrane protein OmpA-like peptidoglycan-associated protein